MDKEKTTNKSTANKLYIILLPIFFAVFLVFVEKAFSYLEMNLGTVGLMKYVVSLDDTNSLGGCGAENLGSVNFPSITNSERYTFYSKLALGYPALEYHLGQLAFWKGDYERAIDHLDSLPVENVSSVDTFRLGCAKWNLGQVGEAVRIWRSILNTQHYFMSLAQIAEYRDQYETAEINYYIATLLAPDWLEAKSGYRFTHCMNLLERGSTVEVREIAREAILSNVNFYRRQLQLGKKLMEKEEYELAELALILASKMEPQSHWPNHFLGITYYSQQSYALAKAQFVKVIVTEPDFGRGYHWIARTLIRMKRCEEALLNYVKAIQLLPKDPRLLEEFRAVECEINKYQ